MIGSLSSSASGPNSWCMYTIYHTPTLIMCFRDTTPEVYRYEVQR